MEYNQAQPRQVQPRRLKFFARDIRSEISRHLPYYANVWVDNESNDRIITDAYTLLCRYLSQHPDCDVQNTYFSIDCIAETVQTRPFARDVRACVFERHEFDFVEWIKLANSIDKQVVITIDKDGKAEQVAAIEYPADINRIEYCPIDCSWTAYIPKEIIKEISHD